MHSLRRIFFIEDDPDLAAVLNEYLVHLGYNVCGSAANIQDAVAGIQNSKPQLVLVDLMIKGTSGGITIGDYLASKTDIPFIYITAHDRAEVLKEARQTMPDGFLLKPFDERQLRAAIEMAQRVG